MPELPEVEVVRRGLEDHVVGHVITRVEVLHPRPVRRHLAGATDFADRLTGVKVTAAKRRGKYLWLPLDTGDALVAHLGMSGQLLVQQAEIAAQRHLRVLLELDAPKDLRFVDQRMFGGVWVSDGGAELPLEVAAIALDPLDPDFDEDAVVARIRKSTSGIKRLLLNQNVVSGIGNIYADEALWAAQVHGERPGNRVKVADVRRVLTAAREVMIAALAQGGTSFDALYVNVEGDSGYFERSLQAYGRAGEPCSRCGSALVRAQFMNRSSYFCPVCQRRR
ncbi:MAG: bifunctional DNA-formamidopyrimidine glycosylase/DNA-(apurinic or apyrimidinic site) lyase [Nocardioidaceae bacterium]